MTTSMSGDAQRAYFARDVNATVDFIHVIFSEWKELLVSINADCAKGKYAIGSQTTYVLGDLWFDVDGPDGTTTRALVAFILETDITGAAGTIRLMSKVGTGLNDKFVTFREWPFKAFNNDVARVFAREIVRGLLPGALSSELA